MIIEVEQQLDFRTGKKKFRLVESCFQGGENPTVALVNVSHPQALDHLIIRINKIHC